MDRPHQRPRFAFTVPVGLDAVLTALIAGLDDPNGPCVGSVTDQHAYIHLRSTERHFWSPTLDLTLRSQGPATTLHGRFAPHPSIWTFFMFLYAVLALAATLGLMGGLAQLTLGDPPWALLGSGVAVVLIGLVYGATFIGQGLGAEQMTVIRLFLDRTLGPGEPLETAAERALR